MYADPAKLHVHEVKLRFSDEEHALIQAIVNYTGEQKAALLRSIVIDQALEILTAPDGDSEVPLSGLSRA